MIKLPIKISTHNKPLSIIPEKRPIDGLISEFPTKKIDDEKKNKGSHEKTNKVSHSVSYLFCHVEIT
jgi:hypothetical protein